MTEIKIAKNNFKSESEARKEEDDLIQCFSKDKAELILGYHRSLPGYEATPLVDLTSLADRLQLGKIWVKDESKRFNLNAFKVLGASYAFAKYVSAGQLEEPLSFEEIAARVCEDTLLVTATDGNHGYGVAYIAKLFRCKAKVLMPAGTVPQRAARIRDLGAECTVLDVNYDCCVERARDLAITEGGLYIQDTALQTDTALERETPLAIMQGYMTILSEASHQLSSPPTHVFLQAGVGSFSGSLSAQLQHLYPGVTIVIVEPREADCCWRSCQAGDGQARTVGGDMITIMAGLCCGVPSVQGWPILRRTAQCFLSCEDSVTSRGMRILYSPQSGDCRVVSGESGAVCLGALYTIRAHQQHNDISAQIGLSSESRVLVVSTEGDTDPQGFWDSIWA